MKVRSKFGPSSVQVQSKFSSMTFSLSCSEHRNVQLIWIGIPSPFGRGSHNIARRFAPVSRGRINSKVVNGDEGSVDVVHGPFPVLQEKGYA